MSNWNPNSNKHKAEHGGYRKKPTQKDVKALMNMYAGIANTPVKPRPVMKKEGTQLKLF